jgi:hypothetical protein
VRAQEYRYVWSVSPADVFSSAPSSRFGDNCPVAMLLIRRDERKCDQGPTSALFGRTPSSPATDLAATDFTRIAAQRISRGGAEGSTNAATLGTAGGGAELGAEIPPPDH